MTRNHFFSTSELNERLLVATPAEQRLIEQRHDRLDRDLSAQFMTAFLAITQAQEALSAEPVLNASFAGQLGELQILSHVIGGEAEIAITDPKRPDCTLVFDALRDPQKRTYREPALVNFQGSRKELTKIIGQANAASERAGMSFMRPVEQAALQPVFQPA